MLEITCKGSPYEVSEPTTSNNSHTGLSSLIQHQIGYQHGSLASKQIKGSIDFYANLFLQTAKLSWAQVQTTALEFEETIQQHWPDYLEEMKGIAEGAGKTLADIIALNVRTEINFGLFSDGCTALSWLHKDASILAQNWDVSNTNPTSTDETELM